MFDDASLRSYVINAVADDYESVPLIEETCQDLAAADGVTIDLAQIPNVLRELIDSGLVQAYRFVPPKNIAESIPFSPADLTDVWFYITPEGKRQLLS